MADFKKCLQCGADVVPKRAWQREVKKFCGGWCRDQWWASAHRTHKIRSQVVERITGTRSPAFEWTETQAAWLAAIIDGEGTISIWRERRPANVSGFRYRAVIDVANTNTALIRAILALVDGWCAVKRVEPPTSAHKTCWRASVNRRAIRAVLERIGPFLVAKRRQAEVVMTFCDVMAEAPVRGSRVHGRLERLYRMTKRLNRRGTSGTT